MFAMTAVIRDFLLKTGLFVSNPVLYTVHDKQLAREIEENFFHGAVNSYSLSNTRSSFWFRHCWFTAQLDYVEYFRSQFATRIMQMRHINQASLLSLDGAKKETSRSICYPSHHQQHDFTNIGLVWWLVWFRHVTSQAICQNRPNGKSLFHFRWRTIRIWM